MKRAIAPILIGALAAVLIGVLSSCSFSNADVQAKYQCTKTINGHQEKAYCITDTNGYAYYIPYYVWLRAHIGQDETKGGLSSYTSGDSTVPSDDLPAAQRANIASNDGGGDYNVDGSGHVAPVHEAPVEEPVEVHPVEVAR